MLKRLIPMLILALVLILFITFDLQRFLSFEALSEHRALLLAQVEEYPVASALAYMLAYVAVVAFSLPGGLVMTVSGGFLFGALSGGILAIIGATLGATAVFLIAKTSLGDYLLQRAGNSFHGMQKGFAENALSYMFVLRLVPLFPFFLVNLAPAFLGVSLRIYLIATFFGIMPATFVYALAGSGIGSVLEQGQGISLAGVLTPQMIGALVGLALLALLPVVYKRMHRRDVQLGGAD